MLFHPVKVTSIEVHLLLNPFLGYCARIGNLLHLVQVVQIWLMEVQQEVQQQVLGLWGLALDNLGYSNPNFLLLQYVRDRCQF